MDPESCCYVEEEVEKAGVQVALTRHEWRIMGLVWLHSHSKAPFLSPEKNTEVCWFQTKKKNATIMEPEQLGAVNFNQSPARMFQAIGSRFRFFIFRFSPSTPPIFSISYDQGTKSKLFPSFPWTVCGWDSNALLMFLRHTGEPEKLGPSGAEEIEGWVLVPCRAAVTTHFFPWGSGKLTLNITLLVWKPSTWDAEVWD